MKPTGPIPLGPVLTAQLGVIHRRLVTGLAVCTAAHDPAAGLRERCDACGDPATVWTVARGVDTAHCRRCDDHARDLNASAGDPTP